MLDCSGLVPADTAQKKHHSAVMPVLCKVKLTRHHTEPGLLCCTSALAASYKRTDKMSHATLQ